MALTKLISGINWVEWIHLFKMARGFFGNVEAGATPTGTVPEGGVADKSFKDWGDERIILPLIMKLPDKKDRLAITELLSGLSAYERNGFRQVLSGVSSGRTIVIKTSKKGTKGHPGETREEKKEPDFTEDDLRLQVLQEIASMLRDPEIGASDTKDFLRAIGTLPGRSQWEKVQDKILTLYRSDYWSINGIKEYSLAVDEKLATKIEHVAKPIHWAAIVASFISMIIFGGFTHVFWGHLWIILFGFLLIAPTSTWVVIQLLKMK